MQEKMLFLQQARIGGLLRVFLIKTVLSASPAVYFIILFLLIAVFLFKKNLSFLFFSQMNILDPDLEWWRLVLGIRE